jgi:hypothetical protein
MIYLSLMGAHDRETLNADRKSGKYVWSAVDQQQSSFGTIGRYC